MRWRRSLALALAVVATTAALMAPPARAQSYGDHDQVLTIGAAEFNLPLTDAALLGPDGYLDGGTGVYRAPLSLPEGALIEKLCLYSANFVVGYSVSASLVRVKLVPAGGGEPAVSTISASVVSGSTDGAGYGVSCTSPFTYALRSSLDIDGDGAPDNVAYYVNVDHLAGGLGFGAVRVTWRRQVSDPPLTPTFEDVPLDDEGFSYIEALKASSITAGCDATHFCPDQTLTRRQMAVFLAKALGLHWSQ